MKIMKLAAVAVFLTFGSAMAQEVEKKMELKVVVQGDENAGPTEMHWVSDDAELDNLAVGESRTLTGESGEEVTVTRTADGMQFEVEGETINVPEMSGMGDHGKHMVFVSKEGAHDMEAEDIDVRVIGHGSGMMQAHHSEGVTIISAEPLDESTKDSIRSVLISAGNDDEVIFIDGSDENRQVKVIKKKIQVQ